MRGFGADAEARREAEGVLQPARDDLVGDADIDEIGQVVARGGLRGGEADRAGEAADDGDDALALHALDLLDAGLRVGAGVAEDHLELGAAQRLDAAGGVDVGDREFGAGPAELAVHGERAGDGLQDADLDRGRCLAATMEGAAMPVSATAPPLSRVRRSKRLFISFSSVAWPVVERRRVEYQSAFRPRSRMSAPHFSLSRPRKLSSSVGAVGREFDAERRQLGGDLGRLEGGGDDARWRA